MRERGKRVQIWRLPIRTLHACEEKEEEEEKEDEEEDVSSFHDEEYLKEWVAAAGERNYI